MARTARAVVHEAAAGPPPTAVGEGTVTASPLRSFGAGCGPPRSCPAR